MNQSLDTIAKTNDLNLQQYSMLGGGDINDVYLLQCDEGNFVVKVNDAKSFPGMFEAEQKGLEKLIESQTFTIPNPIAAGTIETYSYLLLEHIEPSTPDPSFWSIFAEQLAHLHKSTSEDFGLDHDNFIGSLRQSNKKRKNSADFFIMERLEPQFKLAMSLGYSFSDLDPFYKNSSELIPEEPPSLVHGDLWNGNYMVSNKGLPVLIDPAVAYASREMDLAMMQLFGGFPQELFETYDAHFPLHSGWKERSELWQLYYVLVHLNLFGSGYLGRVNAIVRHYS